LCQPLRRFSLTYARRMSPNTRCDPSFRLLRAWKNPEIRSDLAAHHGRRAQHAPARRRQYPGSRAAQHEHRRPDAHRPRASFPSSRQREDRPRLAGSPAIVKLKSRRIRRTNPVVTMRKQGEGDRLFAGGDCAGHRLDHRGFDSLPGNSLWAVVRGNQGRASLISTFGVARRKWVTQS
jgi:hypothetical protein